MSATNRSFYASLFNLKTQKGIFVFFYNLVFVHCGLSNILTTKYLLVESVPNLKAANTQSGRRVLIRWLYEPFDHFVPLDEVWEKVEKSRKTVMQSPRPKLMPFWVLKLFWVWNVAGDGYLNLKVTNILQNKKHIVFSVSLCLAQF